MIRTFTKKITLALMTISFVNSINAQCTSSFTGLQSNYCTNSSGSVLTPSPTNGQFLGPGMAGSTFSPSLAGPGTHTITYGICSGSYVISSSTLSSSGVNYGFTSASSETQVTLGDDAVSAAVPIGFNFQFFCSTYNQLYIGSNGFVTFNASQPSGCCQGGNLPTNTTPDNLIAGAWTDLYPPLGGIISYGTVGTAPIRTMVVTYSNIAHYSGWSTNPVPVTFQIKLFESSNIIEIHTQSKPGNSQVTTMGLQNNGATIGVPVPGRNANASWTATVEAIRFTPTLSCTTTQTTMVSPTSLSVTGNSSICSGSSTTLTASGNITYTWSGGTSSNSNSVVVNPTSNTTYSISATNSVGCVANGVVTVNVFSGLPTLSITSSTNSVCLGKTVTLTASGALGYSWNNSINNGVGFTPSVTTNYIVTGTNTCGSSTAAITVTVAPLSVVAAALPTLVCAGTAATMAAVAAASNYTWMPSGAQGQSVIISPSATTVYTVTASDGTCAGTTTLLLQTNPVPTISAAASATSICQGITVTLTAMGGLNYTWTPGSQTGSMITVNPTAPISYSVAGDNSFGCLGGAQQIVIVTPSPTLIVNTTDPLICAGASATLSVNGADTYSWSSGGTTTTEPVTPSQITTYSVVGTNTLTGCSTTSTIQVDVFTPSVTISGNSVICNGATSSLQASGASSYTWSWGTNNVPFAGLNANPTITTVYNLNSITSTLSLNCADTKTFQVTVNPNPTVTAVASRTLMCKGETNTLTASGAGTYSWNTSATTNSIVITSSLVTTINFTVTGTNAQGCIDDATIQVKVEGCVGVSERMNEAKLAVFPNPSNGQFVITYHSNVELSLINELGQFIKSIKLDESNNYTNTVNNLSNGVYFITGEKDGKTINQKIIVNK